MKKANFGLDLSSRVAVVGPNGAGKSTMLNLLIGKLRASNGYVQRNSHLKFGIFTQHHADQLDLALSAIRNVQVAFPEDNLEGLAGVERVRAHLGRYGVVAELANKPVALMSGGQKSRVSFAMITWKNPHFLVLDEPTNHLDLETIDALSMACSIFKGGIIVVSHDQSFVEGCADEVWEVDKQQGRVLKGGLEEYKNKVLRGLKAAGIASGGGGGESKR